MRNGLFSLIQQLVQGFKIQYLENQEMNCRYKLYRLQGYYFALRNIWNYFHQYKTGCRALLYSINKNIYNVKETLCRISFVTQHAPFLI